jgi:hypothetical protein
MRTALIAAQAATFVGLAVVLARQGEPKLALAQALLAVVTWAVYSA